MVIPAGVASANFSISAVDDTLLDGTQNVAITVTATGYQITTQILAVTDYETLTLSISPSSMSENGGSALGTVSRNNTDIDQPLTVSLTSLDTSEATVPATVTIPAGAASTTFPITAADDALLDGTQTVTISVAAVGYLSHTATIAVTDSEALLVRLDRSSISEKDGTATATIERSNTDNNSQLVVQIVSSDPSEAIVPAVVDIQRAARAQAFPLRRWMILCWMVLRA